eukprot:TRINITY_DN74115_c0_g1_i1.p1 TRINITY_DN74115_c0_g1~~TRINITY_DN74115_c0_g1_i1.p1  ORF type:complete len:214 (-),score=38.39 TRINITY_DN74115_c0_g1_i1:264-860(-)
MAGFAVVRIRGLQSAAHLNGTLALCKGFNEENGRWLLELASGEEKAIKNDNILSTVEPGSTLMLERGCVAHVTIGQISALDSMEVETRESLDHDFGDFCEKHGVRAEFNTVDGWPQLSVLVRGVPDEVQAALPKLERLMEYYGIKFKCTGDGVGYRDSRSGTAADVESDPPETLEVDGMNIESKGRRARAKPKNRYGL